MANRIAAPTPILIALFLGALFGMGMKWATFGVDAPFPQGQTWLKWTIENVTLPAGQIFLHLLFMLAVPIVIAAVISSIASLDVGRFGRIGLRTLVFSVVTSGIAVTIGMALVKAFEPGIGLPESVRMLAVTPALTSSTQQLPAPSGVSSIVSMFPENPIKAAANGEIIQLMVFSIIFGIGLSLTKSQAADTLRSALTGLLEVLMTLIDLVLKLAPLGVAALMFSMTARAGTEMMMHLLAYVAVVLLALAIQLFGIYTVLIRYFGQRSPIAFFTDIRLAMLTAFATASSNATLPTVLKVADENLHLPKHISGFVLVSGAVMNQNGSAIFSAVTVVFLAQLFGTELTTTQQLTLMAICILSGIGTAGIPSGDLPVVAMTLAMFNIPAEGIGLILGVERFLDMCRTTVNVAGDLVVATCIAKREEGL